jgi:chromosome segregation protein
MYIKELQIDHFKSFANNVTIPFLQGFTTIGGPNGSGKSNIIDSILFALGFSMSKTLRAEKLSDYISTHRPNKNEAFVKVTFGFENNETEILSVARRIKKNSQGYNSIYYLNDKVCTLSDIHFELEKHNVTPNSYNVVMQNDVMSITNCSNTDRRKIIEEIAGTAEFDRQIEKAENEIQIVEQRVESTNLRLEELAKIIEQLAEEREVALKYEKLKNEKTELESQVSAVKYFDLTKTNEKMHESIMEFGKKKEEKRFELKKTEDALTKTKKKFEEVQAKVRENGEQEQLEVIKKTEEIKGKIDRKQGAADQADVSIIKNKQSAFGCKNGIKNAQEKINDAEQNIKNYEKDIQGFELALKHEQEELTRVLEEVSGLNQTAEVFIAQRTELQKQVDKLRDEEVALEKKIVPLESSLSTKQNLVKNSEKTIKDLEEFKATFKDEKDRLQVQSEELEKELQDFKIIQENSIIELENLKTEIQQKARDIQLATFKLTKEQARRSAEESINDRANDLILNSKIEGVHNSLMNLGAVDDEYATALEVAMGARMRNIVVEDADVAKICVELLKTNRAGTTTFLPLNKIKSAPKSLPNVDRERGVVDYAINLIDFEDMYLDAFFVALGDTLIVEDFETAKRLHGKYRMVTLSGELFDKSGAITGGDRNKKTLKFASTSEDEISKLKIALDRLNKEYDELDNKRTNTENKQTKIRLEYSNSLNALNQAKIELKNLINKAKEADTKISECQVVLVETKKEIESAEKALDKYEIERVNLSENILSLKDKIAEIESKMSEGELRRLKEKTRSFEDNIKKIEVKITMKKNDISSQKNQVDFQRMLIKDNEDKIAQSEAENIKLEEDKKRFAGEKSVLEAELEVWNKKKDELTEKLKQFQEERDVVQKELLNFEKSKDILVNDLSRITDQIEAFRARRREIEPLLEEVIKELEEAGTDIKGLVVPELSTEEIKTKIQRLQKRMTDLEPVNMNAIKTYEAQMARKAELDEKIAVLTKEKTEITERMTGYDEAKKEAFMTTYNAINDNFKAVFEKLADGEGALILENEKEPFTGGMSMMVKPRGKAQTKLIQLSGGEKAITALSLVFAIQKYLPAPFYALDEVDANLDIMNRGKFAEMIKMQSKNTQFVVVSHDQSVVKSAERTLGVTQKEKGVTQVTGILNN